MDTKKLSNGDLDYSDNWVEFKKWINGEHAYLEYSYQDDGAAYIISAFNGSLVKTVGINKTEPATAAQEDFENNFKDSASSSLSSGIPLFMSYPYSFSKDKSKFVGFSYTCTPGTNSFQEEILKPIKLKGANYWIKSPNLGDKVNFAVVDADNILGGGNDAVVSQYVIDMPIAPWDHNYDVEANTVATIQQGLYLLLTYENTGSDNVYLGVTYHWFE